METHDSPLIASGATRPLQIATSSQDGQGDVAADRLLLDALADAVLLVHPESGQILDANGAALQSYGYDRQSLLSMCIYHLHVAGAAEVPLARLGRCGGASTLFQTVHRRRNGAVFPVEVSIREARLPGGAALACVVRDLSSFERISPDRGGASVPSADVVAQRDVEELAALAQRKAAELETALRSMTDAIFLCDIRGVVTLANDAARQLTGVISAPDDAGLAYYLDRLQLRFPDGRPVGEADLAVSLALAGQTVHGREEIGIHPATGAEIDLLVSAVPIRGEMDAVVGAVEVIRDVTRLVELDRLKDQFLAVAAHELKTPLTILKGYTQLLIRHGKSPMPQMRRALAGIQRGTERIDGIVSAVLDASLVASNSMKLDTERLDLAEFVRREIDRAALLNITHSFTLGRVDPVAVLADPVRLAQVMDTLIDNAVRYSAVGASIEVDLRVADGRATVSVRDRGIGIPEGRQSRIFQRFYRAHAGGAFDYGGLGVGLYIARAIIALHGGQMEFESEEGRGSTFRFTLPIGSRDGH